MRRLFAWLGIALAVLFAAVAAKTALMPSRQLTVAPAHKFAVDGAAAAERLGGAVRFKTVPTLDAVQPAAAEFQALQAHL